MNKFVGFCYAFCKGDKLAEELERIKKLKVLTRFIQHL